MTRLILLASSLMTISFICSANFGDKHYVTAKSANIRQQPNTQSSVITTIHKGQKLLETRTWGDWIEVSTFSSPSKHGWIHSSLVESSPETPTLPVSNDAPTSDGSSISWFIVGAFIAAFIAYFLPSCLAFARKHHNRDSVLVINLFLGWTFLGWVVALAMAASAVRPPPRQDASTDQPT